MLPVRHPGDPLPFEIVEFYHMLLDELSIRYVESERERRELGEESMISATSLEDESSATASQQLIDKRKKKIRRFKSRSHSYLDSASGAHSTASVSEPPTPILFEDKSVEEIEGMLHGKCVQKIVMIKINQSHQIELFFAPQITLEDSL